MKRHFTIRYSIAIHFCLILLICVTNPNHAQSVKRQCISSYGTIIGSNNAAFGQTVGQPFNTTVNSANKVAVLQGFEQPVVFKAEAINTDLSTNLILSVYPNPASYSVTLQYSEFIENSVIRVTDLNGRLILSEQLSLLQNNIDCSNWNDGIYILTVIQDNKNISSFKLTINK